MGLGYHLMLVYHLDKEYDGIMKDLTGRTA